MLAQLLKEHQANQAKNKHLNAQLRREAKQAVKESTDNLADALNQKVGEILQLQKTIESNQISELHKRSQMLSKQSEKWISLVENFNSAVKELGDVQHWATVMDRDMEQIALTLETIANEPI